MGLRHPVCNGLSVRESAVSSADSTFASDHTFACDSRFAYSSASQCQFFKQYMRIQFCQTVLQTVDSHTDLHYMSVL